MRASEAYRKLCKRYRVPKHVAVVMAHAGSNHEATKASWKKWCARVSPPPPLSPATSRTTPPPWLLDHLESCVSPAPFVFLSLATYPSFPPWLSPTPLSLSHPSLSLSLRQVLRPPCAPCRPARHVQHRPARRPRNHRQKVRERGRREGWPALVPSHASSPSPCLPRSTCFAGTSTRPT